MNNVMPTLMMLLRKSRRPLMYGSIAAVTVGVEGFFESIVFNCPCEGYFTYGLAFLWAPALFLFLAGILLDRNLWRLRPRRDQEKKKKTFARRYFKTLIRTLDVLVRASIAPVAWLVFSFLQQQYYTCAYFGPPLGSREDIMWNKTHKCHFEAGSRTKLLEENFKTRSQIAGWSLLLIAMSVLFTSVCIRRCIQKGRHLQIPSLEYYHHVEAKAALEHFHAKAKELAKKEAKKEIHFLFVKAENKDFFSCIQDVGKEIENKYGPFFEIPPESPSYATPVKTTQDLPNTPTSPVASRPLLSQRTDTADSLETQESICVDDTQQSEQMLKAPENTSGLARVKLHRQDAFNTNRK